MINVASEVWVPTVVILCPEDYFEQAKNSFWLGTEEYQYSITDKVPEGIYRVFFRIEMIEGRVYLTWIGPYDMYERFGRPDSGYVGEMSDGFESAGSIVDAAIANWYANEE